MLERLGLLGLYALDDTEHLLGVSDIGLVPLTVFRRDHLQLVTICNRLITILLRTELQHLPIVLHTFVINLICQHPAHIHDGKEPFLLLLIPRRTNLLILEQLYLLLLRHNSFYPLKAKQANRK